VRLPRPPTAADCAATCLNNLAYLLRSQGDYATARPLFERAPAICDQCLGRDHPSTRTIRANLAALDTPPPSAAQHIAAITAQGEAAVAAALAGPVIDCTALAAQLEALALLGPGHPPARICRAAHGAPSRRTTNRQHLATIPTRTAWPLLQRGYAVLTEPRALSQHRIIALSQRCHGAHRRAQRHPRRVPLRRQRRIASSQDRSNASTG
jgi:Tetratricopeptide repeat